MATLIAVPSAEADGFTGEGQIQVAPSPWTGDEQPDTSPLTGDAAVANATPAGGTFRCTVPFAAVQAAPSGYVVGNCSQGTEFRRRMKAGPVRVNREDEDYYEGGYILGPVDGCGWIRSAQSAADETTSTWNNCDPNSIGYRLDEFMFRFADGSYWYDGCSGTSECAGTPINNRYVCHVAANVRPWLNGQGLPPAIRYIPAGATHNGLPRLAWRYVTKHPTTEGNHWVMVRDRAVGSGQGNWVFVPLACL